MPLYPDIHRHLEGLTADAAALAGKAGQETREPFTVRYLDYWLGEILCLVDASGSETAGELIEIRQG